MTEEEKHEQVVESFKLDKTLKHHDNYVRDITLYDPDPTKRDDPNYLISCGDDAKLFIINLKSCEIEFTYFRNEEAYFSEQFIFTLVVFYEAEKLFCTSYGNLLVFDILVGEGSKLSLGLERTLAFGGSGDYYISMIMSPLQDRNELITSCYYGSGSGKLKSIIFDDEAKSFETKQLCDTNEMIEVIFFSKLDPFVLYITGGTWSDKDAYLRKYNFKENRREEWNDIKIFSVPIDDEDSSVKIISAFSMLRESTEYMFVCNQRCDFAILRNEKITKIVPAMSEFCKFAFFNSKYLLGGTNEGEILLVNINFETNEVTKVPLTTKEEDICSDQISQIIFSNNKVYSSSFDRTIRIFSIFNNEADGNFTEKDMLERTDFLRDLCLVPNDLMVGLKIGMNCKFFIFRSLYC